MDMSWEALTSILAVIISALTTIATYNLKVSSKTLHDLVETVREIQLTQKEHSVKIEYLEKTVYHTVSPHNLPINGGD